MALLDGKSALITGASRGLGRAMAVGYAKEGANLSLCARTAVDLEATAELCRLEGAKVVTSVCDVVKEVDVERTVAVALDELGAIDILVNNAGVGPSLYSNPPQRLYEIDSAEWNRVISTNLVGPFLFMKIALPLMDPGSSVINVISISGREVGRAGGPYPMSKFMLEMFTRMIAEEQRDRGVRVNGLCPGIVAESAFFDIAPEKPAWAENAAPADVIVPAALFLGGPDSTDVTGQAYFGKWFNDEVDAKGAPPHAGI